MPSSGSTKICKVPHPRRGILHACMSIIVTIIRVKSKCVCVALELAKCNAPVYCVGYWDVVCRRKGRISTAWRKSFWSQPGVSGWTAQQNALSRSAPHHILVGVYPASMTSSWSHLNVSRYKVLPQFSNLVTKNQRIRTNSAWRKFTLVLNCRLDILLFTTLYLWDYISALCAWRKLDIISLLHILTVTSCSYHFTSWLIYSARHSISRFDKGLVYTTAVLWQDTS
jgi:hypothetical protein